MPTRTTDVPSSRSRARQVIDLFAGADFRRFLVVGGIGFVVDGAVLYAMMQGAGLSAFPARLVSFTVAVLSTWILNRVWTFRDSRVHTPAGEFVRYVAVQLTGGACNVGVFTATVWLLPGVALAPALGLVLGSATGLLLNFLGARFIAFSPASPAAKTS